MTTAPPPVAQLDAVTHRYGATVALDAVSAAIPSGRMVGLIAGVRRLQTGEVTALGGPMRAAAHRRVSYSPKIGQ